jgi:glycosyltransferase involved in cell wall biosynthesis
VSNRSLTIVLPVYNSESRLTNCVTQVLELASDLTSQFSILIVDDGSTDDTSAVARELSARYPQVQVRRQRNRSGLGPIISMVRRSVVSDVVIVHDGVTPIDTVQVRRLWRQSQFESRSTTGVQRDISELANIRGTHTAMAKAHERVMGFHLLEPLRQENDATTSPSVPPATARHRAAGRSGVGHIPPLPRPNFLSVLAEFTLGE